MAWHAVFNPPAWGPSPGDEASRALLHVRCELACHEAGRIWANPENPETSVEVLEK